MGLPMLTVLTAAFVRHIDGNDVGGGPSIVSTAAWWTNDDSR